MKKHLASLLFLCFICYGFGQEISKDSLQNTVVAKTVTDRNFTEDLKDKYSDNDFVYKEQQQQVRKKSTSGSSGFLDFFVFFMSKIFPFLLGGFIIFLLLKVIFGLDIQFWKKGISNKKSKENLIYEDEDVHEVDVNKLLIKALEDKNYRLAIRYYYLQTLRDLSNKKMIDYHKDKTNTEYLFEIENLSLRNNFSQLTYIYSYVWYGEFVLDAMNFKKAEEKYQSFLNQLI